MDASAEVAALMAGSRLIGRGEWEWRGGVGEWMRTIECAIMKECEGVIFVQRRDNKNMN